MSDLLLTTFHNRICCNWLRTRGLGDDEHRFTIPTDRQFSRFDLRITPRGPWSDASIKEHRVSGSTDEHVVKVHYYYAPFGSIEYYLEVYHKGPTEAPVINASSYMLMTIIMRPSHVTAGDTSTGYVLLPSPQATDTDVSLSLAGAPATLSTPSVKILAHGTRSPDFSVVTSPRPGPLPGPLSGTGSGAGPRNRMSMITYEEIYVWGDAILGGVSARGKGTVITEG